MTDDATHEGPDDLRANDELSDEALDRAAGQGGKLSNNGIPLCIEVYR